MKKYCSQSTLLGGGIIFFNIGVSEWRGEIIINQGSDVRIRSMFALRRDRRREETRERIGVSQASITWSKTNDENIFAPGLST